jgi:hypothetical protein
MTLPTSLAGQANISLSFLFIYAQFGGAITGTLGLSDSYYLFPRNSTSITRVNS